MFLPDKRSCSAGPFGDSKYLVNGEEATNGPRLGECTLSAVYLGVLG